MAKFKNIKEFESYKIEKNKNKIIIKVGLSSCGIAAGGERVYNTFQTEIAKRNLKDIELMKVGCLGLCYSEPNVEVIMDGMPDILYGKVDEKFAVRILEEHIINKSIINHNIYDKPHIDILKY